MTTGDAVRSKSRKKGRSSSESKGRSEREICFVIAPFGGWNDRYYEDVYCPAVEGAGLQPKRADDLYRPSAIVHDIWAFVKRSKVMLADVTGKNPNVFYELGLAHAIGKPVVIVTRSMDDVPFDLRALRVIEYDVQDPEWSEVLVAKIQKAIREVMAAPEEAVPPTFLHERKGVAQPTVTPLQKKMLALQQQVDLIRAEVRSRGHVSEVLSPREAEVVLDRYIRIGLPLKEIRERLMRRGVPSGWIDANIHERKVESKPSPISREVPPPAAVASAAKEPGTG
jgi:hypothetical protein